MRRLAVLLCLFLVLSAVRVEAACNPMVSSLPWRTGDRLMQPVALGRPQGGTVGITFIGHATFLIESPGGIRAATDYNDMERPDIVPDIATMNHAHMTHYTDRPDPAIRMVLRGWNTGNGAPRWNETLGDMQVRNLSTDIRTFAGDVEANGNSIFVFETGNLCIAHLGHLHQVLNPSDVASLGEIDVLLAPVDGTWTLSLDDMAAVIDRLHPPLVIPMHYFGESSLTRFLDREARQRTITRSPSPTVQLSRETLPKSPTVLVLAGY